MTRVENVLVGCDRMNFLYEPPINLYISFILLVIAVVSIAFSIKRFITAYHHVNEYTCSLWFIRGIRFLLISLTSGAWSASFFLNERWLFIIGLVIICQEIYEGAIISSALRDGAKIEKGSKLFS